MERPEYQLDFEVTTYFTMKEEVEMKIWDGSRIVFCSSEGTNKGFIIYQMDTLNHGIAKEEGMKKVNAFLNLLMITSNIDNITPTIFAESPKLLNPDRFKEMRMTITKPFTATSTIVAHFQKQWADSAGSLTSKIHMLSKSKQATIDRSLFWLRKGAEATSNERFIYRWVSFEALSGVLDKPFSSTERLVNSLINSLRNESAKILYQRNEGLVSQLVLASLIGGKNRNRSEELKEAINTLDKNGDYKAVTMKTALCIYEVRNKFLHKGEAVSLINGCNTLLRELIHALIRDLI